jgi:uncharacterized protein
MSDTVVNNAARDRFELEVGSHIAASYYSLEGDVVSFLHTEVPPVELSCFAKPRAPA